jgi:hypothetical protein
MRHRISDWGDVRDWTVFQFVPNWSCDGEETQLMLPPIASIRYLYAEEANEEALSFVEAWRPKRNGVFSIVVSAGARSFFLSQMWNEVVGEVSSWELVGFTAFPLWPYRDLKFSGTQLFFRSNPWMSGRPKAGAEGIVCLIKGEEVKIVHRPTSTMHFDKATKTVAVGNIVDLVDYDGPSGSVEYSFVDRTVVRAAPGKEPHLGANVLTPTYRQVAHFIDVKGTRF